MQKEVAQEHAQTRLGHRRADATGSSAGLFSPADRKSFARLSARLGGPQGLAAALLGRDQPVETLGDLHGAVAWSTAKVPIAAAIFASGKGDANQADLERAITASDNAAGLRLWSVLGGGATAAEKATIQLRHAGDQRTVIQDKGIRGPAYTPFGQTQWDLRDQVRYVAGIECSSAGRQVADLMRRTVPSQRWGLGLLPGDPALKGGWGPGSQPGIARGYLDRQMGIVDVNSVPIAVAIASLPSAGTHEAGISDLNAMARWLPTHLHITRSDRAGC